MFAAFSLSVQAEELAGPRLVAELRNGGYVLYIRHTSTDFSTDDPKRYDALRKLLAAAPVKRANNAISSHGNPYMAVFDGPYLAEGEIAVVRPGGKAGFETVARIRLGDWGALAP